MPTLGSKEAIFHLAQVRRRRPGRRPDARLPGARARRAVRRQAGARAAAARPSAASCPTSTPSPRRPGRASAMLWLNYPNNPTAATAPLELYEQRGGARARARLRARLRRGLLGALLRRRAARVGAPGRRPHATSRCSTRCPSARRCPATARASSPATRTLIAALKRYRPERRRRAAGVRPARGGRRLGRRGARRATCARVYRAKRDVAAARARGRAGSRHAGGDATFFLWLDAGARRRGAAPRELLEHGIVLAPGLVLRRRRAQGYLRLALVPTLARVRARRASC